MLSQALTPQLLSVEQTLVRKTLGRLNERDQEALQQVLGQVLRYVG